MSKRLPLIFVFFVLAACGPAPGSEGGPCLEGNTCEHDYLVCGADGTCVVCGFEGDPCCDGGTCRENHICQSDGVCVACGWDQTPCCEGDACVNGYVCSPENECVSCGFMDEPCCSGGICDEGYICGEDGICEMCGYADEVCCPGNTCMEWHICTSAGKCDYCGELGQLSCEGPVCKGWHMPHEGMCEIPFEVDVSASLTICEKSEPGEIERHHRDWCYWYAAFWKVEPAICESIEWEKMRDVCERGANPDDYDITWTVR